MLLYTALATSAASVSAPAATVFLQAVDSKNGKNIDTPIGSVVITVLAAADPFASAADPVVSVIVAAVSPVLSSIPAVLATVTTALVSLLLLGMKSLPLPQLLLLPPYYRKNCLLEGTFMGPLSSTKPTSQPPFRSY